MDNWRVAVLGDGGVGKTALAVQTYDPTIEDAYRKQLVVDNRMCFVEVIDTAGQGYEREVSKEEGAALARQFGCEFIEASAKTAENVEHLFMNLVRALRKIRNIEPGPGPTKPVKDDKPGGRWIKCVIISLPPFSRTSFFHGEPLSLLTYAPSWIISLASPIVLLSPKSANGTERTSITYVALVRGGAADRPRYCQPNAQGANLAWFGSSERVIVHHKGAIMSTGKLESQDVSGLEKIEATASGKHAPIMSSVGTDSPVHRDASTACPPNKRHTILCAHSERRGRSTTVRTN
ncbi:ras protein [Salix suchowensis]|nr:ras protein [Salix suchowensis]